MSSSGFFDTWGTSMEAWLSVEGGDPVEGLHTLDEWLSNEPELRGMIRWMPGAFDPQHLGSVSDALVAGMGAGGAISVLAGSLKHFLLRPRGSDFRIVITVPDGRTVELEAQRVDDVEALVRQVLEAEPAPEE